MTPPQASTPRTRRVAVEDLQLNQWLQGATEVFRITGIQHSYLVPGSYVLTLRNALGQDIELRRRGREHVSILNIDAQEDPQ
jgi:hypothetical protein